MPTHLPDFVDITTRIATKDEGMASLAWLGLIRVAGYKIYMEMVCPHEDGLGEEKRPWSNPTNTCAVPRTQSLMAGDRRFTVAGLRLWNTLPVELLQRWTISENINQSINAFISC